MAYEVATITGFSSAAPLITVLIADRFERKTIIFWGSILVSVPTVSLSSGVLRGCSWPR